MGEGLGHVDRSHTVLVVLVGITTMTLSTYMILGGEKLYSWLKPYLVIFEKKHTKEPSWDNNLDLNDHVILVGCDRTGKRLVTLFQKEKVPFVVIDFNPKVYERLTAKKVPVILGDLAEEEVREKAEIGKARMVISTVSALSDNLVLLEAIKGSNNSQLLTILTAHSADDARNLYKKGASYVIIPNNIAGDYVRHLIKTHGLGSKFTKLGKNHYKRLLLSTQ